MSALYWLSFCDPGRPKGEQFLGACLVEGQSFLDAVRAAHRQRLNPGGEVKGLEVTPASAARVAPAWRGRLLTRQECEALDRELCRLVMS
jgi:hypothetical protein